MSLNPKVKIQNFRLKFKTFYFLIAILTFVFLFTPFSRALAGPSSPNFQLLDYGFGSGGVATSSSTNFLLQGISGEIEFASPSSANFILWPGLTYTLEPNVPPAPTFTNPSNYYNKLQLTINTGNNSTDTTYVIEVSTDKSFITNLNYVQTDDTLGVNPVWQTYTVWGGSSGTTIIGLNSGTTYYARVAAKRGTFQQGRYGALATASTINPTFTFNLQTSNQTSPPFSVGIGVVNAGQITTSWQTVTTTISTNAGNGGIVYIYDANAGLKSLAAGNYTIASVTNNLGSVSEGYGAQGTSVTQTSGGPMELISPYNGTGNSVGILDSSKRVFADSTSAPVTAGSASFQLKAKAANSTPAGTDYTDTLTIIATGSF